ncbi:tetratricopeptide repeat protein [Nubsella zeaxanthinifaciens]|uniref:tetratricopeptide repeat protein n=1 Tax=Nubsella zeaxanthinifaciens TaxID=392412 RepID=UPI003CFC096A
MKIEYLLGLFELGQYKQCLAQLQDFLNIHANHTNALLLKAKCLFEISNSKYNRYYEAYDDFIKVLDADPNSLEAFQYATYISVYIIKTDPEKSLELCNKWLDLAPQVHQVEALQYRAQAYRTSKNYPLALKDYDQLISIIQLVFADDRIKLDSALAMAYIEKGQTYLNDLNNPNVALQVFKDSFKYQLPDSQYYFDIASLAFSLQDFEFGGAVALRLFSSGQTVTPQQV